MYVLVDHHIADPATFWNSVDPTMLPAHLRLHHTFPTRDGTRAVCLWEAKSVAAVRDFLEPLVGRVSHNEYLEVENRDGVVLPSEVAPAMPSPT
jgi:hypothetical protein